MTSQGSTKSLGGFACAVLVSYIAETLWVKSSGFCEAQTHHGIHSDLLLECHL